MSNHDDIKKSLKFIKTYPKANTIFFQEHELSIVLDGKLLPMKSHRCQELSKFDEFYLYVDADHKAVSFLAFSPDTDKSEEGTLEWESIEMSLLTFLVVNIQRLTSSVIASTTNRTRISDKDDDTLYGANIYATPYGGMHSESGYHPHKPYNHTPYTTSGYSEKDYKEREAINEQLRKLLKSQRMGQAIDFINGKMGELCDEKNFDSLNILFTSLPAEFMTVPVMVEILRSSRGADHLCTNRGVFFTKAKERIAKTRNDQAMERLMTMAPGIEYPGIAKMSREKVKEDNVQPS